MGSTVTKSAQESDGYLASYDPAPFFDYETGGSIAIRPTEDKEFNTFSRIFYQIFQKPPAPERELCESDVHYQEFLMHYNLTKSSYEEWTWQCYAHIKNGYRVGIPYLENTQRLVNGKNIMKPNLPPLRYRHAKLYLIDGKYCFSGTAIFVTYIKKKIGSNVSNDVCNRYFDEFVRSFDNAKYEHIIDELFIISLELLSEQLKRNDFDAQNSFLNEDQSKHNYDIIPFFGFQEIWGKGGRMKIAFPTMWYRFLNDISGDGSKVELDYSIPGFPRFFEDFEKGTINGMRPTTNYNQPSEQILKDARAFTVLYGFKIIPNLKSPNAAVITEAHQWLVKENRWKNLESWLLNHNPDILYYYYTIWSQFESTQHIIHLKMMTLCICSYVYIWMVSPTPVIWMDGPSKYIANELDAGNLHHIITEDGSNRIRPPAGTIVKSTNTSGQLIGEVIYGKNEKEDITIVYDIATGHKATKISQVEDGYFAYVNYDVNTGQELDTNIRDRNGELILRIKIDWVDPKDYSIKPLRPKVFSSTKMKLLRTAWMNSHFDEIVSLKDIITGSNEEKKIHEWYNAIPYDDNLPPNPKSFENMDDIEYEKYIFQFMKKNIIKNPCAPSIFEDPKYRDLAGNLIASKDSYTVWETKCIQQWNLYCIWVESNVLAYGKPNYVMPGKIIAHDPMGSPVMNVYPDIGILAKYESVGSVFHVISLPLNILFGDSWWSSVLDLMKNTLTICIEALRYIYRNFVEPYLPDIALTALLIGAVVVGGLIIYDYIDESVRVRARK